MGQGHKKTRDSITAIRYCMKLRMRTLTRFNVFRKTLPESSLCQEKGSYHSGATRSALVAVKKRIEYKVALITHKVLHHRQPQYLAQLVDVYQPPRQLRSSSQHLVRRLTVCRTKLGEIVSPMLLQPPGTACLSS